MLIIKHSNSSVFIPEDSEFSVYTQDFPINEKGKRLNSPEDPEFADFNLDLVIETVNKRYRFEWINWGLRLGHFFYKLEEALNSEEKVKIIDLEKVLGGELFYNDNIGFSVETITK